MSELPTGDLARLMREVREVEVQAKRLVRGVIAGGYHSVFRGAGIEFEEVREYAEGDDPRSIDWNVSARYGRPFVKKYVDERELCVLFLLDLSPSMEAGFGAWSARQVAVRVMACMALSAIANHDKVGLVAFGKQVVRYLPPRKGSAHGLRILRDALALPTAAGGSDLVPPLELVGRVARRHAIVFLLSDFLSEGWERALELCARRHDLIAVRILPPELGPAPTALVCLRDPESGGLLRVDWKSAAERERWQRHAAESRARSAARIARAGADRIDVHSPPRPDRNAIQRPLLEFFRMRERRGAKR